MVISSDYVIFPFLASFLFWEYYTVLSHTPYLYLPAEMGFYSVFLPHLCSDFNRPAPTSADVVSGVTGLTSTDQH